MLVLERHRRGWHRNAGRGVTTTYISGHDPSAEAIATSCHERNALHLKTP